MIVESTECQMNESVVLWLGYLMPRSMADRIFSLDTQPAVQTQKFGLSCVGALRSNYSRVVFASVCPIQNYPLGRKIFFWGGRAEISGMRGLMLGFVNVLGVKHVTRFISCMIAVLPYIREQGVGVVFVHGIHTPYLLFASIVRSLGGRTIAVLTDPPGVILPTDGVVARWLKKIDTHLVRWLLGRCSGVVALAPGLVEKFAVDSPHLVFPGILEEEFRRLTDQIGNRDEVDEHGFTIVYAGGLNARYGVDRLVEAVQGLDPQIAVRLKLFGRGDQEQSIIHAAECDARIIYGGFVDTSALMPELLSADLLINPRPTEAEFVSLSFPSKLIEYLATGRPVLTTRIPTIPVEMEVYFNFIEDESAQGIRSAILRMIESSSSGLREKAARGRDYVRMELAQEAIGEKMKVFASGLDMNKGN